MRICDWLSGTDSSWVREGFKNSFFYQHYAGEKTEKSIIQGATIIEPSKKCVSIFYWDTSKDAFILSIRRDQKWEHHTLKTKMICYGHIEKEYKELLKEYKDLYCVPSPIFEHLKTNASFNHYHLASNSDKIASVYVY